MVVLSSAYCTLGGLLNSNSHLPRLTALVEVRPGHLYFFKATNMILMCSKKQEHMNKSFCLSILYIHKKGYQNVETTKETEQAFCLHPQLGALLELLINLPGFPHRLWASIIINLSSQKVWSLRLPKQKPSKYREKIRINSRITEIDITIFYKLDHFIRITARNEIRNNVSVK